MPREERRNEATHDGRTVIEMISCRSTPQTESRSRAALAGSTALKGRMIAAAVDKHPPHTRYGCAAAVAMP